MLHLPRLVPRTIAGALQSQGGACLHWFEGAHQEHFLVRASCLRSIGCSWWYLCCCMAGDARLTLV
eukprot:scaffold306241_cov18-Tisochrysis_lutea.AAC.1